MPPNDLAASTTPGRHREGGPPDATDLLAQFPTEHTSVPPVRADFHPSSIAAMTSTFVVIRTIDKSSDPVSPSTLPSEVVISDFEGAPPLLRRPARSALERAWCVIATVWSLMVGSARRCGSLLVAATRSALNRATCVIATVWSLMVGSARRCGSLLAAATRFALDRARYVIASLWSPMLHCVRRGGPLLAAAIARTVRAAPLAFNLALTWVANAILGLTRVAANLPAGVTRPRSRANRRSSYALRAWHVCGHFRRSYQWAYPAGLFLSGVMVGTFLVTSARAPSDRAIATVVSVNHAAAPSTSFAGQQSVDAPPPAAPEPTRVLRVSTSGVAPAATTTAAPPAPRPEPQPRQPGGFRGSFAISSRPEGAAVFMNGRQVGTTPLVLENLPVGSRAVRVTLAGYETWSKSVQVVANERTTVAAALNESPTTSR